VALLAHLLVSPQADTLWEAVYTPVDAENRPAFLEQTDGVSFAKEQLGVQLIAVANDIKYYLDLSMFEETNIGSVAA
jgi:hypothetical protein